MTETSFQAAYDRWQRAQFPKGSRNEDLDDLHGDLAYIDSVVADAAIPYATEGRAAQVPQPVVDQLNALVERSGELEKDGDPDVAHVAGTYREYGELLQSVIAELPHE
jgi:hypothetical protein